MLAASFKMEYIADIAFILILLIFAIINGKKGFVSCFFSFATVIVSVLAALFLCPIILEVTGGLFGLEGVIQDGLGEWLSSIKPFNLDISMEGWQAQMEQMALPQFIIDAVLVEIEEAMASLGEIPAGTMLGQYVGQVIGSFLTSIICAIALFIVVKLVMLLLRGVLNKIVSASKFIEKINVLLGAVTGIVIGFIFVCALLAILTLIPVPEIAIFFDNTMILNGLYHNNPILVLLGTFILA